MYGDAPDRWSPALAGLDRLRFAVNCLTRLRFVDADGRLLLTLKGPPDDAPRRSGALVPPSRSARHAGRPDRVRPLVGARLPGGAGLRCLDTGCVWGGALCAIRLDREEEPRMLPCRGEPAPDELIRASGPGAVSTDGTPVSTSNCRSMRLPISWCGMQLTSPCRFRVSQLGQDAVAELFDQLAVAHLEPARRVSLDG